MRGSSAALLLLLLAGSEAGVRKRWTPNWDLNTKSNWKNEKLPCGGGVASLPRYPENSLFIGGDLTLGSLDLPVDGEVIVGEKARFLFDHTSSGDCEDAEWTHGGHDQWWDPEAWAYPGFEDSASSPVPHLHRVPCTRDAAIFPAASDSLFTVHLSPPAISVTTLSVGNRNFTTSELAAYVRTPEGELRFRGISSSSDGAPLYVESPEECTDVTGCLCGSEPAASAICRIMSRKCGTPRCDDPIKMTGFCCPVCGAEITINHAGTLSLASVRSLVQSHLQGSDMKDIRGHVAKMSDQFYHVYFTAANPDGDYKEASESFKTRFNEVLNTANSHEVLVSYAGDMKPLVSGRVAPHHVAVTLVTLTICLGVGAAVYYFRKRRISSSLSFMFRRLDNNSRRVSVVSDVIGGRRPSNASSVFAYSRESGLRFLNPIFNQSMASLAGAGVSSVINESAQEQPEEQEEGQHENPMYTAFQNMNPEERKASEKAMEEEREKILEAAGQLVASSMKNNKEKRMSVPSENNLESITEEKDTKDVVSCDADVHHTEGTADTETPKASSSSPAAEENTECVQGESLVEDNEKEIPETDANITPSPPKDIDEVAPEDKTDPTSSNDGADVTQTLADIGEDAATSSGHVEHKRSSSNSSSSSSSSDDEDADGALRNLEGFTPLVDLKFEK